MPLISNPRKSNFVSPWPTQFAASIASPRNALRGLERDSHQVPRHGIGDALRGRNRARKPKTRTGFLPPMSGVLNLHLGPRTDHGGRTSFAPFGLGEVARWPKFLKDAKLSKRSGGAEPLKCDVHAFRFFFSRDLLAASPPRITQRS